MGKTVTEINQITDDIVSFDMRPEDTEVYMKYISPLPTGSRVVDFGTGMAKNVIRMALCAPHVEIWTWDWGHGNPETIPHKHFKLLHDTMVKKGAINNIYFVIADSDKAWPTWDWPIDVLNIDAGHDYDSMTADLKRWEPFVKSGGYIFIHDYEYNAPNYKFESMRKAVKEYLTTDKFKFLEYTGGTQVICKI